MSDAATPTRGLTPERRWEILWLFALAVGGLLLTARVSVLLEWTWVADGALREVVRRFIVATGIDIDHLVVFLVGLVAGWLTLFFADETKRAQKPLLLVNTLVFIALIVLVNGRWIETIGSLGDLLVLLFGWVAGVLIAGSPWLFGSREFREFPVAAWALFLSVTAVSVLSVVDLYLLTTPTAVPASAVAGAVVPPTAAVGVVVDSATAVGLAVFYGTFLLYRDHRDVVIVGPRRDGVLDITLLAGLFATTKDDLDGTPTVGAGLLGNAQGKLYTGTEPTPIPQGERVGFSYLPDRTLSRRIVLSVKPIGADQLGPSQMQSLKAHLGDVGPVRRRVRLLRSILLPGWLRGLLNTRLESFIDAVSSADAVLFVVSMEDFVGDVDDPSRADQLQPPAYLDRYQTLAGVLQGNVPIVTVLMDAERAEQLYRDEMGGESADEYGRDFTVYVTSRLLGFDSDSVVPVTGRTDSGVFLGGVEAVRSEIDEH